MILDLIREKYPQYKNIPDNVLGPAVVEKYPVYIQHDPDLMQYVKPENQSIISASQGSFVPYQELKKLQSQAAPQPEATSQNLVQNVQLPASMIDQNTINNLILAAQQRQAQGGPAAPGAEQLPAGTAATLAGNEALAGTERAAGGFAQTPVGRGFLAGFLAPLFGQSESGGPSPYDQIAEVGRAVQQRAEERARAIAAAKQNAPPTEAGKAAEIATRTGVGLAPFAIAGTLGGPAIAATAFAQSAGSSYLDQKAARIQAGKTPEQASDEAVIPSLVSGAISATIFGMPTGFAAEMKFQPQTAIKVVSDVLKHAGIGGGQMAADTIGQRIVEKATIYPNMPIQQIVDDAVKEAAAGGLLVGTTKGLTAGLAFTLGKYAGKIPDEQLATAINQSANDIAGRTVSQVRQEGINKPGDIISITGPDGQPYRFRYEGQQEFIPGRPPLQLYTPMEQVPGVPIQSTVAGVSLEQKGYQVPGTENRVPVNPKVPPSQQGFTTEKGSTYIINADGTTTRNKAPRPEHPGEFGPQKKSTITWYVTPEQAILLGEVQAQGGPKATIAERGDGTIGVKYLEGKDKGKFEKRTLVIPQYEPAIGLTPVEKWDDAHTIHFGNKIISINQKPQSATPSESQTPTFSPAPEGVTAGQPPLQQKFTPTEPGAVPVEQAPQEVSARSAQIIAQSFLTDRPQMVENFDPAKRAVVRNAAINPTPDNARNFAALFDLQYNSQAIGMPDRYKFLEGRQPAPSAEPIPAQEQQQFGTAQNPSARQMADLIQQRDELARQQQRLDEAIRSQEQANATTAEQQASREQIGAPTNPSAEQLARQIQERSLPQEPSQGPRTYAPSPAEMARRIQERSQSTPQEQRPFGTEQNPSAEQLRSRLIEKSRPVQTRLEQQLPSESKTRLEAQNAKPQSQVREAGKILTVSREPINRPTETKAEGRVAQRRGKNQEKQQPVEQQPAQQTPEEPTVIIPPEEVLNREADKQAAAFRKANPIETPQVSKEQNLQDEALLKTFKKAARESGGLGIEAADQAAREIQAKIAGLRSGKAQTAAAAVELHQIQAPIKPGEAPKRAGKSATPFDVDTESSNNEISRYRKVSREVSKLQNQINDLNRSRQAVPGDLQQSYDTARSELNLIRKQNPGIEKTATKTKLSVMDPIVPAKQGFDPNNKVDVLELEQMLKGAARKGPQGSRTTSRVHVLVAERNPEGQTEYRAYTVLPKAPDQIRRGNRSTVQVVVNPKAQSSTRLKEGDAVDFRSFIGSPDRQYLGAIRTSKLYRYYTKPLTDTNQFSKDEVQKLLEMHAASTGAAAARELSLRGLQRITAQDLQSERLSKAPRDYEADNSEALIEPDLASELEAAMSDISGQEAPHDLGTEYVARHEVGRMMKEPVWAGVAGMFWNGIDMMAKKYGEDFHSLDPSEKLVRTISENPLIDTLSKTIGSQSSNRERSQFINLVRTMQYALSKNPTDAGEFMKFLRGEAYIPKQVELTHQADISRTKLLLAPRQDLAANIANSEGFTRTLWDAYRYAALRSTTDPKLSVGDFIGIPEEIQTTGYVPETSGIVETQRQGYKLRERKQVAAGVRKTTTIPNKPFRPTDKPVPDMDVRDVIMDYPASSGFFTSGLGRATAGRVAEVAPYLAYAVQKAIDEKPRTYEDFRNIVRRESARFAGTLPEQFAISDRTATVAERLAAIQKAERESDKTVIDRLYDWATKTLQDSITGKTSSANPVVPITAAITKLAIDIIRSKPVADFAEWVKNIPDDIRKTIEDISKVWKSDFDTTAKMGHTMAMNYMETPAGFDPVSRVYVRKASQAIKALAQAREDARPEIAAFFLSQQKLIGDDARLKLGQLYQEYDPAKLPDWAKNATEGEWNNLKRMMAPVQESLNIENIVKQLQEGATIVDPKTLPNDKRGILSHGYMMKYRELRDLREKRLNERDKFAQQLAEITKLISGEKIKRADVLEAVAKGIADNFRRYISKSVVAEKLKSERGGFERGVARILASKSAGLKEASAVEKLLDSVSDAIPEDMLDKSSKQIAKWIGDWNGKSKVVGESISDTLLAEVDGNSMLGSYKDLGNALKWLKRSKGKESDIQGEMDQIAEWLNGNKPVTTDTKQFRRWLDDYRKALSKAQLAADAVNVVNRKARQLTDKINAAEKASRMTTDILNDPSFSSQISAAADYTDTALNDTIRYAEGRTPRIDFVSPTRGTPVSVSLLPDMGDQNRVLILSAISDIENYLADPVFHDGVQLPDKQRAYKKMLKLLKSNYLNADFSTQGGSYPDSLTRTLWGKYFGWTGVSVAAKIPNKIASALLMDRHVFKRMGGLWGQIMAHVADRIDSMEQRHNQIDNDTEFGIARQIKTMADAINSHKLDINSDYDLFKVWQDEIIEPIIASQQTLGSRPYKTGDIVFGHTITKEDMDYISTIQRWERAIRRDAQSSPGDSDNHQANAIEIMDGDWTRKSSGLDTVMPRRANGDMIRFVTGKWQANSSKDQRLQLLNDPQDQSIFRRAVLGYIMERNPEFERKSPFARNYKILEDKWSKGEPLPLTWDDLVDQLIDHGGIKGSNHQEISDQLYNEVEGYINRFAKEETTEPTEWVSKLVEDVLKGVTDNKLLAEKYDQLTRNLSVPNMPDAVRKFVSAFNQYTKPRGRMMAPSTFYDYAPVSSGSKAGIKFSARQVLNLRLLRARSMVLGGINSKLETYGKELEKLTGSLKQAKYKAATMKEARLANERGGYYDYARWRDQLNYDIANQLSRTMTELEDINSPARQLWSTVNQSMVGGLLSQVMAMFRNVSSMFGIAPSLAHASISPNRGRSWTIPWSRTFKALGLTPDLFLSHVSKNNPQLRDFIQSHRSGVTKMLNSMMEQGDRYWDNYRRTLEAGIIVKPDWAERAQARMATGRRGGTAYRENIPWYVAPVNRALSTKGGSYLTEWWNANNPNVIADRWSNAFNYDFYRNVINRDVRNAVLSAMKVRSGAGADLSPLMDKLTARELGYPNESQLSYVRQFLQPVASLESIASDLWSRWDKAPESAKDNIPLFGKENDEMSVIQDIVKTVAGSPFESTRLKPAKGGGAEGMVRKALFQFVGWPVNWLSSVFNVIRTVGSRERHASMATMLGLAGMFMSWIVYAAAVQHEPGRFAQETIFNEPATTMRFGNLSLDDPKKILQYGAVASANLFPYVGAWAASLLGTNDAVRSFRIADIGSIIPIVNFAGDIQDWGMNVMQTGDWFLPTASLVKRWAPSPLALALNWTSDLVGGEAQSRGPFRALRAAAPTNMSMALRSGGGGPYVRTRLSGLTRRMIASAFDGDRAATRGYYNEARQWLISEGKANPDRIIAQSLSAKAPERIVFNRKLTPQEESTIISRMTPRQRANYLEGARAFRLLSNVVGRSISYGNRTRL